MRPFQDFLTERLHTGGFTTEDALAAFLPLARQVAAAHKQGKVAPLAGVADLHVEGIRIYFEEVKLLPPRVQPKRLRELESFGPRAVQVVGEYRMDVAADNGARNVTNLQIGVRGQELSRAVYLPGYVSWEHEVGHHDPVSDVFVLGLILASLGCNLDLNQPDQLASFADRRRSLFDLNPKLHPVLAKAIVRMTELERRRRPQDLGTLVHALENYRDQGIDLDFDLARTPNWKSADPVGRRSMILSCLRKRLFDVSRRNRLLHFKATNQTVNLTWASVPLTFDLDAVQPEHLLTWNERLQKSIVSGQPLSLNKYLRFEDAVYLPGLLDAIRNDARRDQAEYGFAQLRLVACFLRWTNLKEKPIERFDSPLVLLPVRLHKTKGVRDLYTLECSGTEAEINPALRHYLHQLYAVDLPARIDLETQTLDELHALLKAQIQASEPAVTLEKIDRPRISLIQAQAQRRLDQYRRRMRLSGRGVRSFQDLDYSYDRANYHPLGLRLFQTRLQSSDPQLRTLIEELPRPRSPMAAPADVAEGTKERRLYSQAAEESNPFAWEFDLCDLTLGNFHYRKMSLVRDYSDLLERNVEHPGFDALFSTEPRPAETAALALPQEVRFPIVSCDSTQASAIALARTGRHFIIQGPPGTGKSQTITNLIADYVARGLRVLFVCEKRAAIDVVHHRLKQAGLEPLCCLIHDSQDDKKPFVMDLKATYEAFLQPRKEKGGQAERKRTRTLGSIAQDLAPLERFSQFMQAAPVEAGLPMRDLLERAIDVRSSAPTMPAALRERVPDFRWWQEHRERIGRLHAMVEEVQGDEPLAKHPLRLLHPRFAHEERPLEKIRAGLNASDSLLEEIDEILGPLNVPPDCRRTIEDLRRLADYASMLAFLAHKQILGVLEPKSDLAKSLAKHRRADQARRKELEQAQEVCKGWKRKLDPQETENALKLHQATESSVFRFLRPAWWRLRGMLRRGYDFSAHQIPPTWTQILTDLGKEHEAQARVVQAENSARDEFFFDGSLPEFLSSLENVRQRLGELPPPLRNFHRQILASSNGPNAILQLAGHRQQIERLTGEIADLLATTHMSLEDVRTELDLIGESLDDLPDFVPCLRELSALPPSMADALRSLPWRAEALEAAMAVRTAEDLLRSDPAVNKFSASVAERHAQRLATSHQTWLDINAEAILERVRERFLEHVRLASLPHAELTAEQKEVKPRFNRGRRELEHEFGKTMRYRPIRDLVAGDTGLVLRDLKPVWLMSPLSVSDALPLAEDPFDVVIFDEASQVTLEEAVPAVWRAKQILVVGDEKQLPPTNFFAARGADDEERPAVSDEDEGNADYDLSGDSLLNHAARKLPATMLRWHYRSRSESLIGFSNAAFYHGRLLTVPAVQPAPADREPIRVKAAEDGSANASRLLARPLSFHLVEHGVYLQRRNQAEADYIAYLVRGILTGTSGMSVGIIAFSEAQQGEIEKALDRLTQQDKDFRELLEAEREREVDGQFVGLLVKNLENIQGDERDVILLSVCYAPGPDGKMRMNFGPINQTGGERRLNVAFSRAKKHMAVISTIRADQITNDYNDGARTLKQYLRYAEAMSEGNLTTADRVLWEANPSADNDQGESTPSATARALTAALRAKGLHVDAHVGQSDFRCDLAVRNPQDVAYRLGILIDDEDDRNADLLEREVFRPLLLRDFGWNIVRVLTKDWFQDSQAVLGNLDDALAGRPTQLQSEADDKLPASSSSPRRPTDAHSGSVRPAKRYLEFVEGSSRKFWEIRLDGTTHIVRFGRLGSAGQTKTKNFPDEAAAEKDTARLIREKLADGYIEKSSSEPPAARNEDEASAPDEPTP